jgi:hypothetical protein
VIKGWTISGAVILLGLLFAFEKLHAFTVISNVGRPANWTGGVVRYDLYDVPGKHQQAIHDSFAVWTEVTGVDLFIPLGNLSSRPANNRDGRNTVSWVKTGWNQLKFGPPANALAVTLSSFNGRTGEILDSDIYFNDVNFSWGDATENPNLVDVHNIGTHEVGHLLGLDHSSVSLFETDQDLLEATMFYASSRGEIERRIPRTDDELGIRSLYPKKDLTEAEEEEGWEDFIEPPARIHSVTELTDQSFGSTVVFRVTGENFSNRTSFVLTAQSASTRDAVSRYRTILSPNEAEVQISLGSFDRNQGSLLAFNDVEEIDSYPLDITTLSGFPFATFAQTAGGAGGCQIQLSSQGGSSSPALWALLLFALALMGFRKFYSSRPAKSCQGLL